MSTTELDYEELAKPRTSKEILEVTRRIFAASHWTARDYAVQGRSNEGDPKVFGCAVGGLRYAALAPMEHALDEAWMYNYFPALGGPIISEGVIDSEAADAIAEPYLTAVVALCRVTWGDDPESIADLDRILADEDYDVWEKIAGVEDKVITWNDSYDWAEEEERLAIVNEQILPAFDRAIAAVS